MVSWHSKGTRGSFQKLNCVKPDWTLLLSGSLGYALYYHFFPCFLHFTLEVLSCCSIEESASHPLQTNLSIASFHISFYSPVLLRQKLSYFLSLVYTEAQSWSLAGPIRNHSRPPWTSYLKRFRREKKSLHTRDAYSYFEIDNLSCIDAQTFS